MDEIPNKCPKGWISFSKEEFISFISKCNNSLTPGPNKLSWRHLKYIIKDNICLKKIINIADVCFDLGHWPLYFKISTSIIISKPNKKLYNFPKTFKPIALQENLLRKLLVRDYNSNQSWTASSIQVNWVVWNKDWLLILALPLHISFVWDGSSII